MGPRTQFDALHPEIGEDGFRRGLHICMLDQQQPFKDVRAAREALLRRYKEARRIREMRKTEIGRAVAGTCAAVGDLVLVKEADVVLAKEGIYSKLAHQRSTGPREGKEVVILGLTLNVIVNGRSVRGQHEKPM